MNKRNTRPAAEYRVFELHIQIMECVELLARSQTTAERYGIDHDAFAYRLFCRKLAWLQRNMCRFKRLAAGFDPFGGSDVPYAAMEGI